MTRDDRNERRRENETAARYMAKMIRDGRLVGAARAERLAISGLRRFPMKRYPGRAERFSRVFEWIFAQTRPRKGKEKACDRERAS